MTNKDLAKLVLDLKAKGYQQGGSAWNISASFVAYESSEDFSVIYVLDSAPYYYVRTYDLHPNTK